MNEFSFLIVTVLALFALGPVTLSVATTATAAGRGSAGLRLLPWRAARP